MCAVPRGWVRCRGGEGGLRQGPAAAAARADARLSLLAAPFIAAAGLLRPSAAAISGVPSEAAVT